MEVEIRRHLANFIHKSDSSSARELEALVRAPGALDILLQLVQTTAESFVARDAIPTAAPPELLLCCQLLQKALRRASAADFVGGLTRLLPLIRASAAWGCGWTPVLTQLSLALAVMLIRTEDWHPAQLLSSLGTQFGLAGPNPALSDGASTAMLSVLTVLAEEIHAPAAKLSVAPSRLSVVRNMLRQEAVGVLSSIATLCHQQPAAEQRTAATLRCVRAWCTASLVEPRVAVECELLLFDMPLHALLGPHLAALAAEALCAVIVTVAGGGELGASASDRAHDGSDQRDGSLLLPFAARLLPRLRALPPSAPVCMVVVQASESLAAVASGGGAHAWGAREALEGWLHDLLRATTTASHEESGLAFGCWPALQELADASASPLPLLEALAPFRQPLLVALTRGGGSLPLSFASLSAEERDDLLGRREETRAVMRASAMCDARCAAEAVHLLQRHAEEALGFARSGDALRGWQEAEAALHAASAAAKHVGATECAALSRLMRATLPEVALFAEQLMVRADESLGLGRGLLATLLVLVGAYAEWLGAPAREAEVAAVLPLLRASLRVPEVHGLAAAWPLRSKQEHAGAVALMKLCAAAARHVLAAISLPQFLDEMHGYITAVTAPAQAEPSNLHGLISSRSADLLLDAMCSLITQAAGEERGAGVSALAHAVLIPPWARLHGLMEEVRHSTEVEGPTTSMLVTVLRQLAILLSRCPVALRSAYVQISSEYLPQLCACVSCSSPQIIAASCDTVASMFKGCQGEACPGAVRPVASALLHTARIQPLPQLLKPAEAVLLAFVLPNDSTASRIIEPRRAEAALEAETMIEQLGSIIISLPRNERLSHNERQQLLAAWLNLAIKCSAQERAGAFGATSLLVKAQPFLLQAVWRAVTEPPPESTPDREGFAALTSALATLREIGASTELGRAMQRGLSSDFNGSPFGSLLVRALLVGMSTWMPSWILGDLCTCCWDLRERCPEFRVWLTLAISPEGIPRPVSNARVSVGAAGGRSVELSELREPRSQGLNATHKKEFETHVLETSNRAHFKASVKQFCGGKKKNTVGTPSIPRVTHPS